MIYTGQGAGCFACTPVVSAEIFHIVLIGLLNYGKVGFKFALHGTADGQSTAGTDYLPVILGEFTTQNIVAFRWKLLRFLGEQLLYFKQAQPDEGGGNMVVVRRE